MHCLISKDCQNNHGDFLINCFIGFQWLMSNHFIIVMRGMHEHTACVAENTSIFKVTTVTCVSIIGTVGQVVFSTSACQIVKPNGTSTLSIVSI